MSRASASLRTKTIVAFATVSVIWGSTFLAIRVALVGFAPFLLSATRFLVAGAILYGVSRARGETRPTARQWGAAAVTGTLFFVVGNALVNVAERTISSGLASILVATMPFWATLFLRVAGERASSREWTGLGVGLAGVVVLNLGTELRSGGLAAAVGLAAPAGWALGSVASKRLVLPKGMMCTASQMLMGGAACLVVSVLAGEVPPSGAPLRAWLAVAYLAVFGSIVGFSAYTFLLRNTRAAVATRYAYVNPVVAVALGVALAGEHLDVTTAIGGLLVLTAVLLLTQRTPTEKRATGGTAELVPSSRESLAVS
jgi:drug/metabolite transporter (DMT)-like permease